MLAECDPGLSGRGVLLGLQGALPGMWALSGRVVWWGSLVEGGRWVGLSHAVTTPDVLTSQVLGTFTSDMAVHARLISPKGQLSEVPALLSWESGAMLLALGQGWTVAG